MKNNNFQKGPVPRHEYLDALRTRFNLITEYVTNLGIDQHWDEFVEFLNGLKKERFLPNDKIPIVWNETEYFIPGVPAGLSLINLFTAFKKAEIPFHAMLLIYGSSADTLNRQIEWVCKDHAPEDRPTVVEYILVGYHHDVVTGRFNEPEVTPDSIDYHAICTLRAARTHRHALINHIKHLVPEKIFLVNHADYK